jgi:hypothetical protein
VIGSGNKLIRGYPRLHAPYPSKIIKTVNIDIKLRLGSYSLGKSRYRSSYQDFQEIMILEDNIPWIDPSLYATLHGFFFDIVYRELVYWAVRIIFFKG